MISIHRVENSVFSSNTYILTRKEYNWCWIIDVGDIQPIIDIIPGETIIKGILLTHTHYDHIYGINRVVELYPESTIYTSESGIEGLLSDKFNFSRYHDDSIIFKGENISILHEEDEIELFPGDIMKVTETPGHDKSCLTYYTKDIIFTGDSFIPGLKVITTFPLSNKRDAIFSVEKIKKLIPGKRIYPGHGESYDYHSITDLNC